MLKPRQTIALAFSLVLLLADSAQAMRFKLPSIGYHTQGAKIAILDDVPEGQKIEVSVFDPTRRNPKFPVLLGASVYKIEKTRLFQGKEQGPALQSVMLDFSDFKEAGTYELHVEGTDVKSPSIKINDFLYWDALGTVVKSFYFQRCGQAVEEASAKIYHPACHLKDANFLTPNRQDEEEGLDVIGGWHNGGDYTKYTTSTALSAARLMAIDEWDPQPFKFFRLNYPLIEPGYGTTDDFHHEIQAGLEWLMAMQRRDGAFYRKVAGKQWPGIISPDDDEQPRYIYGASTQDTAAAAATFAMAARDFKKVDLGYSVKSLLIAEKAWGFLETHPNLTIERTSNDASGSGEFINPKSETDAPYRLWAAAELYTSTGKAKYHQAFLQHLNEVSLQRFSWNNPTLQGISDYLLYAPKPDPTTAASLKQRIIGWASNMATSIEDDVYSAGLSAYAKGSNQEIAERANALLVAYRISGQERFRDMASRSVAYLFGVNPLGMTFVTGIGDHAVQHPTHRWMQASGKVVPGYMVSGPNNTASDGVTPKGLEGLSYVDDAKASAVNESTLLDNVGLAYLLGVLNASYNIGKEQNTAPKTPLEYELAPERPRKNGKGKSK